MTLEKKQKSNQLQIPGKTFLVGEYAILAGGECLGLGTSPFFSLTVNDKGSTFHPDSPAGLFLKKNNLTPVKSVFVNPYGGGGFGGSTAEFILSFFAEKNPESLQSIFSEYLNLYSDRVAEKPSGADLVTQLMGNISHIQISDGQVKHRFLPWNFKNLDFLIFSTGLKVKTHEHLARLDRKLCVGLIEPSREVIAAYEANDEAGFKEMLKMWTSALKERHLTASEVLNLKETLETKISGIQVKPCGALGADVVIVLCAKEAKSRVLNEIQSLSLAGLKLRADSSQLADGPCASL